MRIYGIEEKLERKTTNTTEKGRKQIITRMINKVAHHPDMNGYSPYKNKYAFLDGHRVFISHDSLGIQESGHPFNLEKLFTNLDMESEIKIPREYVEYLKKVLSKDYKKPMIVEDEGFFIGFNPDFILDAIKFSNSETFYYSRKMAVTHNMKEVPTLHNPLFQKDEDGNIITVTLPICIDPMIDDLERSLLYVEVE